MDILHFGGKLVVVEGINGSGKSSVAKAVQDELDKLNVSSVIMKVPDSPYRDIALTDRNLSHVEETLIFYASHVKTILQAQKYLQEGKWVILDRYEASLFAMQGVARKQMGLIQSISRALRTETPQCAFLKPDLTIFLDVPLWLAISRRKDRDHTDDRLEEISNKFEQDVQAGYQAFFQNQDAVAGHLVQIRDDIPAGIIAAMALDEFTSMLNEDYNNFKHKEEA
jgi:dTMP kinase